MNNNLQARYTVSRQVLLAIQLISLGSMLMYLIAPDSLLNNLGLSLINQTNSYFNVVSVYFISAILSIVTFIYESVEKVSSYIQVVFFSLLIVTEIVTYIAFDETIQLVFSDTFRTIFNIFLPLLFIVLFSILGVFRKRL